MGARVPGPKNKETESNDFAYTADIIDGVIKAYELGYTDVKELARKLKSNDTRTTANNIWDFVKKTIRYRLDPVGYQWGKTPARTLADRFADCKSLSILVCSLLSCAGIPNKFRFVGYSTTGNDVSHVYSVCFDEQGREIILDTCWKSFNAEKAYNAKSLIEKMTKFSILTGIPQERPESAVPRPVYSIDPTIGEVDLNLITEGLALDRERISGISGIIADAQVEEHDLAIYGANMALAELRNGRRRKLMHRRIQAIGHVMMYGEEGLSGIGNIGNVGGFFSKLKNLGKKVTNAVKKTATAVKTVAQKTGQAVAKSSAVSVLKKTGALIKKAGQATAKVVAKGAKATAKVVTTGAKALVKVALFVPLLLAKGILEVSLPLASMFFLYLFITNKDTIAHLPAAPAKKRAKAERIARFIVGTIGMKESHFMGICRNGIKRKSGKPPEELLKGMLGGKPINGSEGGGSGGSSGGSGAGAAALSALAGPAIAILMQIMQRLFSSTGKKGESVSADDAPSESDFAEATPVQLTKIRQHLEETENSPEYNLQQHVQVQQRQLPYIPARPQMQVQQEFQSYTQSRPAEASNPYLDAYADAEIEPPAEEERYPDNGVHEEGYETESNGENFEPEPEEYFENEFVNDPASNAWGDN